MSCIDVTLILKLLLNAGKLSVKLSIGNHDNSKDIMFYHFSFVCKWISNVFLPSVFSDLHNRSRFRLQAPPPHRLSRKMSNSALPNTPASVNYPESDSCPSAPWSDVSENLESPILDYLSSPSEASTPSDSGSPSWGEVEVSPLVQLAWDVSQNAIRAEAIRRCASCTLQRMATRHC